MAQQPPVGQGLLIIEDSWSHSVTLLWTSDQPVERPLPEDKQHSQKTDIHATGGIRTQNPSKREAADPHLRPRGHCDRQNDSWAEKIFGWGCTFASPFLPPSWRPRKYCFVHHKPYMDWPDTKPLPPQWEAGDPEALLRNMPFTKYYDRRS